ncbi:MAG TPA: hypothetical protein PLP33_14775 [Leptospiraceae bacterium]|nr:hypothetical protein [Leptospiraceae bacterium]
MQTKIKEDLYLVREDLPKNQTITPREDPVNRIIILDGSGSMHSEIERVRKETIKTLQGFRSKDTATVGVFSSKGDFHWVCKGATPENAVKLVEKYRFPLNMTCYSDILADLPKVIADLLPVSQTFALFFMSDGYPNQDTERINDLVKALAPKFSSSVVVGFGDWYGKELLANMAKLFGGTLVHSSNLTDFSQQLVNFREGKVSSSPRIEFSLPANAADVIVSFSTNGDVISHDLTETLSLAPDTEYIAYLTNVEPKDKSKFNEEELLPSAYAVARAALQAGKYLTALDVLAAIGDVKFIDMVGNSNTVSEYGVVENELLYAIDRNDYRFRAGKKKNYLPKEDALCVVDLIEMLYNDKNAKFHPYHDEFEYKKVSPRKVTVGNYPKFNAPKDTAVSFASLVWTGDRLNLGAGIDIKGTIELDDEAKNFGLSKTLDTSIFRTYNFIFDGKRNVDKLPVSGVSAKTLKILRENDLIESEQDGVFILNITALPVINRKIAKSYTDLNQLCEMIQQEKQLEVEQKVYGYLFKEFPEDIKEQISRLVKPVAFTDAQIEYLAKFGVNKDGKFAPKSENGDLTDFLPITFFEFDIDKAATIPTISKALPEIQERLRAIEEKKPVKPFTPMQKLIADAYVKFEKETVKATQKSKALWLKERVDTEIKKDLRRLRSNLNKAKLAVVVGKTNFDQIPKLNDGNNPYTYNGTTYLLKVKKGELHI